MEEDKHFNSILHLVSPNTAGGESPLKIVSNAEENSVTLPSIGKTPSSTLQFDRLSTLTSHTTSKVFYKECVMDLVSSVLKGYNGTLVSLGQECTENFSFVLGSSQGILLEAAKHILQCIKKLKRTGMSANLVVPCSYVLIMNETIHDLLQGFSNEEALSGPGEIQSSTAITISDSKVKGAKTVEAKSLKNIVKMLQYGSKAKDTILISSLDCRTYQAAFTIGIEYAKFGSMFAPVSGTLTSVVVVLPDDVDFKNLGENASASSDAKGIVALSSVIHQLTSCSSQAPSGIPYESSTLTRLLQAAFGGNSKTLLMTHLPSAMPYENHSKACSILELGSIARNIQNRPDKTELAEKALMDAYRRELQRMYGDGARSGKGEDATTDDQKSNQDEEVMVARALASAVKEEFEDEDSDESGTEDSQGASGYTSRTKRVSLKPRKRQSKMSSIEPQCRQEEGQSQAPEDITIEALVVLIQDPDNGVPRALESALVNVQIHRGIGSVFSGAAIIQWLLENIDGVNSEEDAEQLGQILLDKGAIFHSEGSSLFLNSESLFYYARHARSGGKALSVEEIRALLAPPVKEEKAEPTLQVTTIAESTAQEIESGTTINLDTSFENCSRNDRKVRSHPDNTELTTILEQHDGPQSDPHPTTHSPQSPHPTTNSPQSPHPTTHSPQSGPHTATDDSEVHESTVPAKFPSTSTAPSASTRVAFASEVDTRHGGTYQTSPVDKDGTADGTQEETSNQSRASQEEKPDEPNVQDIQGPDLVALESSSDYPNPLHFASAIGKDTGVIRQLVNWYGVDHIDKQNRTPLMFAAIGNKASVCQALIDCGAVLDKRDQSGLTAAHFACFHGSKDVLSVLIKQKANLTIKDRMLHTVYHWSIAPESPQCLQTLIRHSKESLPVDNQIDKHHLSPLHWAVHYDRPEHLKLLVKKSRDLLKMDSKGRTLMTNAIGKKAFKCIPILLSSEAGDSLARAPDRNGLTPLHHASACESPLCTALILNHFSSKKGKNVNSENTNISDMLGVKDIYGRAPLHYATIYQRLQNLQILLQFGADTSVQDNDGRGPLETAEYFGEVSEDVTKLIQNGPESEVDLKAVIDSNKPQSLSLRNNNGSEFCNIL